MLVIILFTTRHLTTRHLPPRHQRLPAMQETQVRSLGWEDYMEKEMAPHSSTLAWKILWTEEPGRLQSMMLQRVRHDWAISLTHSPGTGGKMLPFKNVLDLTLKILFNHNSWACLLIFCVKKWEIHISPFCLIPKYYGSLKKKNAHAIVWVQAELTTFLWSIIFTWKNDWQTTVTQTWDLADIFLNINKISLLIQRKQLTMIVFSDKIWTFELKLVFGETSINHCQFDSLSIQKVFSN